MIKLKLTPFTGEARVFNCPEKFTKYWLRYIDKEPPFLDDCAGLTCQVKFKNSHVTTFLVYVPEAFDLQTLVHECVHLTDFVMHYYDCCTTIENTEQRAYTTAHYVTEITKKLYEVYT